MKPNPASGRVMKSARLKDRITISAARENFFSAGSSLLEYTACRARERAGERRLRSRPAGQRREDGSTFFPSMIRTKTGRLSGAALRGRMLTVHAAHVTGFTIVFMTGFQIRRLLIA